MITKALVSFAEGQDYRNLLNVAIPSFYNYSNLHNRLKIMKEWACQE